MAPSRHPRNYLRVRGEYYLLFPNRPPALELPPRARRIRQGEGFAPDQHGTTSACAENTVTRLTSVVVPGNYLRVRGEYLLPFCLGIMRMELPPRARRIQVRCLNCSSMMGTTSACAENTRGGLIGLEATRNYLRVRGEYPAFHGAVQPAKELPPRARRIRVHCAPLPRWGGTTSACAENTSEGKFTVTVARNYLRVRGEYGGWGDVLSRSRGTTSACAENTRASYLIPGSCWNYLRVRGEYH